MKNSITIDSSPHYTDENGNRINFQGTWISSETNFHIGNQQICIGSPCTIFIKNPKRYQKHLRGVCIVKVVNTTIYTNINKTIDLSEISGNISYACD